MQNNSQICQAVKHFEASSIFVTRNPLHSRLLLNRWMLLWSTTMTGMPTSWIVRIHGIFHIKTTRIFLLVNHSPITILSPFHHYYYHHCYYQKQRHLPRSSSNYKPSLLTLRVLRSAHPYPFAPSTNPRLSTRNPKPWLILPTGSSLPPYPSPQPPRQLLRLRKRRGSR